MLGKTKQRSGAREGKVDGRRDRREKKTGECEKEGYL